MALSSFNQPLPWAGLAAGGQALSGLGGDPKQAMANLGPLYQQQYAAALDFNKAINTGVQTGYDQLRNDTSQIYDNIYKNLDARYGDVLGRIAGTNTSNINDIGRNAQAASGAASQQMVSRGLGNTTVQQNMQRAIEADRARETTRSNEAFAQLGANYADRIWGDRTATQQNKAQMMAGLGQGQLSALERINAGYPDAGMFGSLAQMYGAQAEADKNRKQLGGGWGSMAQASGGYSYSPSPWGSRSLGGGGGGGSWAGDSWTGAYQGGGGGGFYQPQSPQSRSLPNAYQQDRGGYSDMGTDYFTPDTGGVGGMDSVPLDNYDYLGGDVYA